MLYLYIHTHFLHRSTIFTRWPTRGRNSGSQRNHGLAQPLKVSTDALCLAPLLTRAIGEARHHHRLIFLQWRSLGPTKLSPQHGFYIDHWLYINKKNIVNMVGTCFTLAKKSHWLILCRWSLAFRLSMSQRPLPLPHPICQHAPPPRSANDSWSRRSLA